MFPSLLVLAKQYTRQEVASFISRGSGRMLGFAHLGFDGLYSVADYILAGKDSVALTGTNASTAAFVLPYGMQTLFKLQDHEGYPGIKSPWGTLSAINLNTGEYAWRIPLGEYRALVAQGIKNTGSANYGGPTVTAGGLVFIAATAYDRKFRAFDKDTGELLWETTLPASGHSTPAVYEVNGRQFIGIAAGGGKGAAFNEHAMTQDRSRDDSGATYVAFALPNQAIVPRLFTELLSYQGSCM